MRHPRPGSTATLAAALLLCTALSAASAAAQAVDGRNAALSLQSGQQGGWDNTMALGSVALPLGPGTGLQFDLGAGVYRGDYASIATGLHLFRRDPARGMVGLYTDWAYVNPEHAGRIGVEGAWYHGRLTLEGLVGVRVGTNVDTEAFDEIDLTWYLSDSVKGSVGHRATSRGHVANLSVEIAPKALPGWSLYGEAETGEDEAESAFAGVRYTFGGARHDSLMARDRQSVVRSRVPRNIVDVTRCGWSTQSRTTTFGLREESVLCGSADDLEDFGARESKQ
jgi:hypothetical protein